MEILAEACGLNPQGGSVQARLFQTRDSEPGVGAQLIVERGAVRPHWSYFLRADTMHGLYTYLENNPGQRQERFHELSHGEGFLEILLTRVNQPGFYLMDEPEAPLSFTACLGLVALLHDLVQAGSQAIVATHSPIVAVRPRREHPGTGRLGHAPRPVGGTPPGRRMAPLHGRASVLFPPPACGLILPGSAVSGGIPSLIAACCAWAGMGVMCGG